MTLPYAQSELKQPFIEWHVYLVPAIAHPGCSTTVVHGTDKVYHAYSLAEHELPIAPHCFSWLAAYSISPPISLP